MRRLVERLERIEEQGSLAAFLSGEVNGYARSAIDSFGYHLQDMEKVLKELDGVYRNSGSAADKKAVEFMKHVEEMNKTMQVVRKRIREFR